MTHQRLTTPRFLGIALTVPLLVGLVGCAGSSPESAGSGSGTASAAPVTAITLVHSAGVNGAAVEEIVKDFETETGIDVTTIEFSDPDYGAKMKLVQQTGSADFDAAIGIPNDVFLLTDVDGVYAKLDTSNFDPDGLKGLKDGKLLGDNYIVNQDITPLAVYSKDFEADPPTSWADFFDTKTYPGYRGLQSGGFGVPLNIIIALLGDGVKPDKLYPLDLDRAFEKLDTIKDSITLWDAAPKAIQDVAEGNTTMSYAFSPAALGAVKNGQPVSVSLFPNTPITRANAAVMENGPHGPAAGNAFLDYWSSPAVQQKYSELTNYGIVIDSQAVYDLLTPDQLAYAPFVPDKAQGTLLDYEYLAETGDTGVSNLDEINNRWNEWRAQ